MGGTILPRIISGLRRGLILFWTRISQSALVVAFTARTFGLPSPRDLSPEASPSLCFLHFLTSAGETL